jgi:hypothetical protein
MSYKVLRRIRFTHHEEGSKIYSFEYSDNINLIKIGEKVGVFEILEDGM